MTDKDILDKSLNNVDAQEAHPRASLSKFATTSKKEDQPTKSAPKISILGLGDSEKTLIDNANTRKAMNKLQESDKTDVHLKTD